MYVHIYGLRYDYITIHSFILIFLYGFLLILETIVKFFTYIFLCPRSQKDVYTELWLGYTHNMFTSYFQNIPQAQYIIIYHTYKHILNEP